MSNYPLRLPDHVMADAKAMAVKSGTSLNQFLSALVAERVGELRAIGEIEKRIARANMGAAKAVLARVPDRAPMRGDEIPAQH